MALRWAGLGKAPALIAMIVAMGRYHIHRLQEEDARHQICRVYDGIFLDDPDRKNISASDLKSFLTVVEEDQTTYNGAKLCRNTMRAYASNSNDLDDVRT